MSAQPRHVADALRLGAAGYLLKDADSLELLKAVDAAAAGRRYFSPEITDIALRALAAPPAADRLAGLSPRERQMALMVSKGYSSAQIGLQLHLSPKTVDTYRFRLMQKLGVADVPALVRLAIREGLVDVND
jgi:DNA-binding NarL/FixJ family response regulator